MNVDTFVKGIKNRPSRNLRYLFHFTETANIPSIREHGLLCLRNIRTRELSTDVKFMSSAQSRRTDASKGLDRHVHLCFFNDHEMEAAKRYYGESEATSWLKILPDIVRLPNVLFCGKMSNANDAVVKLLEEVTHDDFDSEIIFKFMEWSNQEVKNRLNAAKKYEILIPESIPNTYIEFPNGS